MKESVILHEFVSVTVNTQTWPICNELGFVPASQFVKYELVPPVMFNDTDIFEFDVAVHLKICFFQCSF